jgi:hypothetical protein
MIFNKSNNGTAELRKHMGSLYKSTDFDTMLHDVTIASEDLAQIIGQAMFNAAETHYLSANFQKPEPSDDEKFLDSIVLAIQAPIAFYAYSSYSPNADISHESTGRKVKIDNEREKIPFEWLLDRDDEATLNKAHKATERLLRFLDENIAKEPVVTHWKGSDAYKLAHSLFVNNASDFDSVYPIESSRRLFIKLCPFINRAEVLHIKPIIGNDAFIALKTKISEGAALTEGDKEMLLYIKTPLVLMTMATAITRLPVDVLPNGIFQNVVSESMTTKGKKPAQIELIRKVSETLKAEAQNELTRLGEYVGKLNATAAGIIYEPYDNIEQADPANKFMRL